MGLWGAARLGEVLVSLQRQPCRHKAARFTIATPPLTALPVLGAAGSCRKGLGRGGAPAPRPPPPTGGGVSCGCSMAGWAALSGCH